MRLLSRTAEALTFELDRQERHLLVFLLERYPVLDVSYHQLSRPEHREDFAAAQELLVEQLTEAQTANRRRVEEFIRTRLAAPETAEPSGTSGAPESSKKSGSSGKAPSRSGSKSTFTLTPAEADWLLQMVNDVRVGSWVRLGCPESENPPDLPPSKVADFTAMELGGLVQMVLLEALGQNP